MSKDALDKVVEALDNYPQIDFENLTDKELSKFRFVELDRENSRRLTRELKKRKLI